MLLHVGANFDEETHLGLFYPRQAAGEANRRVSDVCVVEEDGKRWLFTAVGGRGNKSPAGRRILRSRERKWMHPQYRGAKATKRSGMAVEESERVTVPLKAGNRTAGTRWRERLAVTRTCCEER